MISKALKFYYPSAFLRTNHLYFSSTQNLKNIRIERRIQECKYSSDLFSVFSQEENITPNVLYQYCYKLTNLYNKQKPSKTLKIILNAIKEVDRSGLTLEQISNFASICAILIETNINDLKLFKEIKIECKNLLQDTKQKTPLYALINIYRFFARLQSRNDLNKIVDKILQSLKEEEIQMKDSILLSKILGEKYTLMPKEKNLLNQLIDKISSYNFVNISSQIKLYHNLSKIQLFQQKMTYNSKKLSSFVLKLEEELKSGLQSMNESHIFRILEEFPQNNIIYKSVSSQILAAIEEDGSSSIAPQLLSKLLKIYSNKSNLRFLQFQKFQNLLNFFNRVTSSDLHYNYSKDILQMVRNGFFSRKQLNLLQNILKSREILQEDSNYIYWCVKNNIIFSNYEKYENFLKNINPSISFFNFPTFVLALKKINHLNPENQVFKPKLDQCVALINNQLASNFKNYRLWKNNSREVMEDFIEEFGDIIFKKTQENITYDQLSLLFQGNSIKHLNRVKLNIMQVDRLLKYILLDPQQANKRIQFINRCIGIVLQKLQSQISASEILEDGDPDKIDVNNYRYYFLQKVLKYLSSSEIHSLVNHNDSSSFINILNRLITNFYLKKVQILSFDIYLSGFFLNLKNSCKNNQSFQQLLLIINKHPEIFKNIGQFIPVLTQMKNYGMINKNIAQYALSNFQTFKNKKPVQQLINYFNVISGNTDIKEIQINQKNLSQIIYLASQDIETFKEFIQQNLTEIVDQIKNSKSSKNICEILLHFNTKNLKKNQYRHQEINTVYKQTVQKLINFLQETKGRNTLSEHLKIYQILNNIRNGLSNHKLVHQFLSVASNLAKQDYNLSYRIHSIMIEMFFNFSYKNEAYNIYLLDSLKHNLLRSSNDSKNKIKILANISRIQIIPTNFCSIKISPHLQKTFGNELLSFYKNLLYSSSDNPVVIKAIRNFLKIQNKDFTIDENLAKYFQQKSKNQIIELNQIIKINKTKKNSKVQFWKNFLIKEAEIQNCNFEVINQSSLFILKINDKYFHVTIQQLSHSCFQIEIDVIKSIARDKIKVLDNVFVIFCRKSNFESIIKGIMEFYPELIPDQKLSLQRLKDQYISLKQNERDQEESQDHKDEKDIRS